MQADSVYLKLYSISIFHRRMFEVHAVYSALTILTSLRKPALEHVFHVSRHDPCGYASPSWPCFVVHSSPCRLNGMSYCIMDHLMVMICQFCSHKFDCTPIFHSNFEIQKKHTRYESNFETRLFRTEKMNEKYYTQCNRKIFDWKNRTSRYIRKI